MPSIQFSKNKFEIIQFWSKENQIKKTFLKNKKFTIWSKKIIYSWPQSNFRNIQFEIIYFWSNEKIHFFLKINVHSLIQKNQLLMTSIQFSKNKFEIIQFWSKEESNQKNVFEELMFTAWSKKNIYSWPQSNFRKIKSKIIKFWRKENPIKKTLLKNECSQFDPKKSFTHGRNPILGKINFEII